MARTDSQKKTADIPAQVTVAESAPVTAELEPMDVSPGHLKLREMLKRQSIEASLVEDGDRSDTFVLDLMEKILNATTADEIFAAQESGMMSGQDFTMRPFYLAEENIAVRKSTKTENGGLPFYFMLKVIEVATGEEFVLNCGGKTFVAVMEGLRNIDYFKVTDESPAGAAVVIVSTPSGDGAYLSLKPFKPMNQAGVRK